MWFLFGEVSSSSGCFGWDGLRYFIVALLRIPYNYLIYLISKPTLEGDPCCVLLKFFSSHPYDSTALEASWGDHECSERVTTCFGFVHVILTN